DWSSDVCSSDLETAAVNKHGNRITGVLNKLGIIIFIPPKAIASVIPDLFTFQELITRTIVVAATPKAAAPEAKPVKPIANPTPTVVIGEMIKKAKEQLINIVIKMGCSTVKVLIK